MMKNIRLGITLVTLLFCPVFWTANAWSASWEMPPSETSNTEVLWGEIAHLGAFATGFFPVEYYWFPSHNNPVAINFENRGNQFQVVDTSVIPATAFDENGRLELDFTVVAWDGEDWVDDLVTLTVIREQAQVISVDNITGSVLEIVVESLSVDAGNTSSVSDSVISEDTPECDEPLPISVPDFVESSDFYIKYEFDISCAGSVNFSLIAGTDGPSDSSHILVNYRTVDGDYQSAFDGYISSSQPQVISVDNITGSVLEIVVESLSVGAGNTLSVSDFVISEDTAE